MKESNPRLTKLICCRQSGNDWGFVCSVQMWPPVLLFCAISLCRRLRRQAPAVCDYPVLLTEYDLLHKDAAVPFIIHRFVNTDALRILNVCRSVVSKLRLKPCQRSEMSFYWFLCKRLKGKSTAHYVRGKIRSFFPQVANSTGANNRQCGGVITHTWYTLAIWGSLTAFALAYAFLSSVSKACSSNKRWCVKDYTIFFPHSNILIFKSCPVSLSWWATAIIRLPAYYVAEMCAVESAGKNRL